MVGIRVWLLPAGLVAGLLLAWLAAKLSALSAGRRLARDHTVIAEYDAPKLLSPAELGYIVDATFGTNELLATLAMLRSKGLVQLTPRGSDDFTIVAEDDEHGDIESAEASVLGYLRSLPDGTANWKRMSSMLSDMAGARADFEDATLGSLVGKGLLARDAFTTALLQRRFIAIGLATIASAGFAVPGYLHVHDAIVTSGLALDFMKIDRGISLFLLAAATMLLWVLTFLYVNMLTYIYLQRDGIPRGATDVLRQAWPDVAGYQLFLQATEYVRLQHDCNPKDPAMPYCLALGLNPGYVRSLVSK